MPKTTSTTSEPEDEGSSDRSVLDFLYHDSRRVGSFLAQFEGDGHLQEFTRTRAGKRAKTEKSGSDLKGNLGVASGGLTGGTDMSVDMAVGYSRVFDPFWANARAFLDYLNERAMLQSDLANSEVGQFVIARGFLSVLDLVMLKDMWSRPAIQRRVLAGNAPKKQSQMTAAEKLAAQGEKENNELMIEMMQILPHSIHASLLTNSDPAALMWGTLREDYMTTPPSDLTLTHGSMLKGEWSMVGILTALPEYQVAEFNGDDDHEAGMLQSLIGQISQKLAPIIRVALGRPAAAHAVTPLLIFREAA